MRITLEQFSAGDHGSYAAYRRIKYAVFMAEQGWNASAAEATAQLAEPEPFDAFGRFWIARTEEGAPAGVIRSLPVSEAFPHRDLFDHHLDVAPVRQLLPALGTVNALAVLPQYRGREVTAMGEWRGGVGSLLVLASLRALEDEGVEAAVATAQGPVAAGLFLRLGFRAIDVPRIGSLQPRLPLMNVGVVLGSAAHRAAEQKRGFGNKTMALREKAAALHAYFDERHQAVWSSRSIEEMFGAGKVI
jgi:GNAT superfamily N-acetyltransferase